MGRHILADITSRLNPGRISPRGFDGGWQACLAEFGVGFQSSVQAGRIDDNRFDRDDSAAFHAIEEAGAPAGLPDPCSEPPCGGSIGTFDREACGLPLITSDGHTTQEDSHEEFVENWN